MGQSVATRFPAPINAWRQGVGRPLVITRAEDLLPRKPFTTPAALSLVAASTGIMLVLRLALGPWVGDRLAFTPFLVSTAGATFWLGWRWGVATALADALLSRLDALARAHNFIRPHSPASTPEGDATLRSLLATLFAPYQDDGLGRLDILGDDVAIGAQAATPLALLFHELATNSVKYGAL